MTRYRHGMSDTRVHNIWLGMVDRCRNDRSGNYGKRGIRVCSRWERFENFLADMGEPPGPRYSIDRIDVNGHYDPSNCRWATRKEQARNTRRNTHLTLRGETKTLVEWCEALGLKPPTVCVRLANGWSVERALTTPVIPRLGNPKPWTSMGMSRSSWYRAGRPAPPKQVEPVK